ncbi:hypothetical protein LCER1_G004693 [Lachnellula cervina]|uniref:Uncharacterized protein n=1 Tax=Lachnellula cervina TaxID=1316786 RepID=A0A7D8YPC5_9HELO|nr:hypothetical protein LCER1_G004693 [Lachnellula cervina]
MHGGNTLIEKNTSQLRQHALETTTSKIALQPYHQAHLSHCLYILLQTLTCDFSTDMITHNWMATQKFPFPDFSINKKCKDHSKLLEWQTREKLSVEMWVEMSERGHSTETRETV